MNRLCRLLLSGFSLSSSSLGFALLLATHLRYQNRLGAFAFRTKGKALFCLCRAQPYSALLRRGSVSSKEYLVHDGVYPMLSRGRSISIFSRARLAPEHASESLSIFI